MTATGLALFDETLQRTNIWLKELMEALDTSDRHRAYLAFRATLHALRDRLPVESAVHLGAQLPMLVRGFYYEGWRPAATPTADRRKEDFLDHIAAAFQDKLAHEEVEWLSRTVLALLVRRLPVGEIRKILSVLPHHLRELWPDLPD